MTHTTTDVRLDPHPKDNSAVLARIGGPHANAARRILLAHAFRPAPGRRADTLVLVRIDRQEAHYADAATRELRKAGITVGADFALQQDFDTDLTWAEYPMSQLSRQEIRDVGAEAQKIYDDIATGHLVIHHHVPVWRTVAAVGTYAAGHSVLLHGHDHLRQVARAFGSRDEAVADFYHQYGDLVRPGPAPATRAEQRIARVLNPAGKRDTQTEQAAPTPLTTVPVYDGDPGDHTELLESLLAQDGEWERYRPHDETTIASHESLLLRVEFVHEPRAGEPRWTVAAYESQVGERLWHATATASTPVEMVSTLLDSLTSGAASTDDGAVSEQAVAHVARPLAGWAQSVEGRFIRWAPPRADGAGVRFDAFAAQARPGRDSRTWTLWGGDNADRPVWAIHLSSQTPAAVLQDLAFELAEGRCRRTAQRHPSVHPATDARREPPSSPPLTSPAPTAESAGRHRHAR
ncbi:DUF317 domain-containing protein [Actinacidiphila sp. DG2A-62]|uniref:DUF317 domain-containing protein n=1 Tax=Actinacidiphila sp. DG2A-62 TaxID=3108821 RepID=UPI002DBF7695|nr:DUF317 domain-containing protein [Actinacidiphila sp. DG2A-62]MEC3997140.1 DUF317 domain-containing protein [Actinacidiphila sp. DG2A-62]